MNDKEAEYLAGEIAWARYGACLFDLTAGHRRHLMIEAKSRLAPIRTIIWDWAEEENAT